MGSFVRLGDTEISVVVGEPGLMPGQTFGHIDTLRDRIIAGPVPRPGYAFGYHSVGIRVPGVRIIKTVSGRGHPLEPQKSGRAVVTCWPGEPPSDGEPGWESVAARLGGSSDPAKTGAFPRPLPLDAQMLTIIASVLADGDRVLWPIWSGWVNGHGRVQLPDGREAYEIRAMEFAEWLRDSGSPRYVPNEAQRVFPDNQPASERVVSLLNRTGYLESRVEPIYRPNAFSSPNRWDTFLPRRTRQGWDHATRGLAPLDLDLNPISVHRYVRDVALAAEGSLITHHGVGPINGTDKAYAGPPGTSGNNPTYPDRRWVPAGFGFPAATCQIDFGGVLSFLKWGLDDYGFYTTGGFATPIVITGDQPDGTAWLAGHKGLKPSQDFNRGVTAAEWGRQGGPVDYFYMNTGGALESRLWHRKIGLRPIRRAGLPFRTDAEVAEVAGKFLGTWAYPRPTWRFRQTMGWNSLGDSHRVAAALQCGHNFMLDYLRDVRNPLSNVVETMTVQQVENTISVAEGLWSKEYVICTDRAKFGALITPRWPQSKTYPRKGVNFPFDAPPPKDNPNLRLSLVPEPVVPVPDPPEAGPSGPGGLLPSVAVRHGPRVRWVSHDGGPLVYWAWPPDAGEMPIIRWIVGFRVSVPAGQEKTGESYGISAAALRTRLVSVDADGNLTGGWQEVSNPWQCHIQLAGTYDRIGEFGGEAVVIAVTRSGHHFYQADGGGNAVLAPGLSPGVPQTVKAVRSPGNLANIHFGWSVPEETGSSLPASYSLYEDDSDALQTLTRGSVTSGFFDPANPLVEHFPSPNAGTLRLVCNNDTDPTGGHTVAIPAATAPAAATTAVPAKPDALGIIRTWYRVMFLTGTAATGTAGPINGIEMEMRRNGVTSSHIRNVNTYNAGYFGIRHNPFMTQAVVGGGNIWDAIESRWRVTNLNTAGDNGGGYGPWSDWASIPAAPAGSVPRDLDMVRSSSSRKGSTGMLAVWTDPVNPPGVPRSRSDIGTNLGTEYAGVNVIPEPAPGYAYPDDPVYADGSPTVHTLGRYGAYDLQVDTETVKHGWGPNFYFSDRQRLGEVGVLVNATAGGQDGPAIAASLAAVAGMAAPTDFIACRSSRRGTNIVWGASMPVTAPEGQPYQMRVRVTAGGPAHVINVWQPPVNLTGVRPAVQQIQNAALPSGVVTMECQARVQGGAWGVVAVYRIGEDNAGRKGSSAVDAAEPGPPRNLRVCAMDLDAAPLRRGLAGGRVPAGLTGADAWSLLPMWDEPIWGSGNKRPSAYMVSVMSPTSELVVYATGNNRHWFQIPLDHLARLSFFNPNPGGVYRPSGFLRIAVRTMSATTAPVGVVGADLLAWYKAWQDTALHSAQAVVYAPLPARIGAERFR